MKRLAGLFFCLLVCFAPFETLNALTEGPYAKIGITSQMSQNVMKQEPTHPNTPLIFYRPGTLSLAPVFSLGYSSLIGDSKFFSALELSYMKSYDRSLVRYKNGELDGVNLYQKSMSKFELLLGYELTNFFVPYLTFGIARGKFKAFRFDEDNPVTTAHATHRNGMAFGAGSLFSLNDKSSLDLRYSYSRFSKFSFFETGADNFYTIRPRSHQVMLGYRYSFGAPHSCAQVENKRLKSGFFTGVSVGVNSLRSKRNNYRNNNNKEPAAFSQSHLVSPVFGARAGYQFEFDSEFFSTINLEYNRLTTRFLINSSFTDERETLSLNNDWKTYATLGLVTETIRPYILFGMSRAKVKSSFQDFDNGFPLNGSFVKNKYGLILGGGIETQINEHSSFDIQATHVNYRRIRYTARQFTGAGTDHIIQRSVRNFRVMAGYKYYF